MSVAGRFLHCLNFMHMQIHTLHFIHIGSGGVSVVSENRGIKSIRFDFKVSRFTFIEITFIEMILLGS